MLYASVVSKHEQKKVAEELKRFLARKGHGALSDLATHCGISTETVRRLRDGKKVSQDTVDRVAVAISGIAPEKNGVPEPTLNHIDPDNPWSYLADDLENLMRFLRSDVFDDAMKARRLGKSLPFFDAFYQSFSVRPEDAQ